MYQEIGVGVIEEKIPFTPQQKLAISHGSGHLRIIACAGSGKTEVVSRRIATLIKNGTRPKSIVAFTFTDKAADELKSRIRKILDDVCPDKADFGDMYIGTIHAFCFEILKELEPKYKNYDVLDEAKRVAYISKKTTFNRLNLWPLMYTGKTGKKLRYYTVINRFISSVDIILNERVDPNALTNEHFRTAFIEYEKMLEEERYLDFSSMIALLITHLENNRDELKMLNNKIKHLVVDEYQDVNDLQEKLIELISIGAESVCVVGDDDQCIYQWRGSHVNNIIDFKKRYSKHYKVTDIPLETNFRSTTAIIHTAQKFINHNRSRLKKQMKFSRILNRVYETGDIIVQHFKNEDEEHNFMVNKIMELLGTEFLDKQNNKFSLSYGDFAILVRTNDDAAKIVDYLDAQGVECIAYSGSTIFERPEVLLTMNCLSYVFNCRPYEYGEKTPSIDILKSKYAEVFDKETYRAANPVSFERNLNAVKRDINKIFAKGKRDYLGDLGLQAVYHRILSALGAEKFDFGDVYNYNLAMLSTAISDYEAVWVRLRASEIDGFFEFAKAYGEGRYMESQYADATRIDAVKVLTVHKAKGLEFPVVFVPYVVEKKRKPNPQQVFIDEKLYPAERYNGNEEDERRVYYTAFTRSEKYLFVTSSAIREGGAKTPYNPHSFLKELDHKYISENMVLKRKKSDSPIRLVKEAVYPTSFTELASYDRCPHDFKLRNVFGYNAGVPAAFGYGTNIHNILNSIHNQYLSTGKVPSDREIDKTIDTMFHLRYATKKINDNMKRGAIKIIKNYIALQKTEFRNIIETEKRFEFVQGAAIISGQIDLLKKMDEGGNIAAVEIIDFKTENDKKDKIYQPDYEKQLKLYAIACMKSLGLNPEKATIHHLDSSKRSGSETNVDISTTKLDETRKEVGVEIDSILKKEFPAKPSKICTICDYRLICNKKHIAPYRI